MVKTGGFIVIDNMAVVEFDARSVTRTVKLLDPAEPGVPDIVPPAARLNPAGKDPFTSDQVYGGSPPEAPTDCA